MDRKRNSSKGDLKISEDVVKKVAELAVLEVKGVAGLSENTSVLGALCGLSPVSLKNFGGVIEITVKIKIAQGAKASRTAVNVQNAVKENVQSMTNIPVSRVDVIIDSAEIDN